MMIFYTYIYLRQDGTPYYVGKGTRHRALYQKHRGGLVAIPPRHRILLEPHLSEEDALSAEKFLISYYGRKDVGTGILINMTDGGERPPLWPKGKLRGPLSIEARNKRKILPRKNRVLSESMVADIRLRRSQGEKQKVLARMFGITQSHVSRICSGDRTTRRFL